MKLLSQPQFDAKMNQAIALLAECTASCNAATAIGMIEDGESMNDFPDFGVDSGTIETILNGHTIFERVATATQELQKGVDPKVFMTDNDTAGQTGPRQMQHEQASNVVDLIRKMILTGTNGRMTCPTGIGRTMILTLACNQLIKEGFNVVYASSMSAMVEQMREFGPDFHTMTFREFGQRDVQEIPCDIVIYDDAKDVDFGDDILAIRMG
ncbi:MAG: hypothetical protein JXR12_06670 [Neptunomonas phycophila]|uniref:hypothetical protein n=1 Tax=Neptunomonas phycophila TaxID=1572645 RepID=UPI003B8B8226